MLTKYFGAFINWAGCQSLCAKEQTVKIEYLKISDVIPYENNPRARADSEVHQGDSLDVD